MIRVGQGAEILPRDLDLQAYPERVNLDFPLYGKPTDIAFNGRFQAERLYQHSFLPADAAEKLEDRRKYYNEIRPRGAVGNKVPISLIIRRHHRHAVVTNPENSSFKQSEEWLRSERPRL
jgi:putative transposase